MLLVPFSEDLVLPTLCSILQGLPMVPRRKLWDLGCCLRPCTLGSAAHLCPLPLASFTPPRLGASLFLQGALLLSTSVPLPPCYSFSLACSQLCSLLSKLLFLKTQFKHLLLMDSAPCPLPVLPGSTDHMFLSVTWTSGIPGLKHLFCTAMVCLLIQLDDQTLGVLRK